MSKKGFRTEDLIEALQDERVVDAHFAQLRTKITQLVEGIVESMVEKISAAITTDIENIVKQVTKATFSKFTLEYETKLQTLRQENSDLRERMDDMDNHHVQPRYPRIAGESYQVEPRREIVWQFTATSCPRTGLPHNLQGSTQN